jgi:sugar phosphate isomerase/epimerase
MIYSLSTRWNACHHTSGEALVEEILSLGFSHIELGYDLTRDLVPGVRHMVKTGCVCVTSVHAFCPVPTAAPYGHPELYSLSSKDAAMREKAVSEIAACAEFAAEMGASTVVLHAGNTGMARITPRLIALYQAGAPFSPRYEKLKTKLMLHRDRKGTKHIDFLRDGITRLLPRLQTAGIVLAPEILPSWEALPTELEMEDLLKGFNSPFLRYWHDIGHGQVRQNLGFVSQTQWLKRLQPYLAGIHVHDVKKPAFDHIMPPHGDMDFGLFKQFAHLDIPAVFEPSPDLPVEELKQGMEIIFDSWR